MNLIIISASQRKDSQSVKVAQYIAEFVTGYEKVTHFELCQYNLPLWGGMASPLLKNILLMCSSQDTVHKPVLLVGISSGISGVYPIAELRMNAFKNNKLVAIPDHLVLRNVEEILNDAELTERDIQVRHRIGYSLHVLYHYSKSLQALRTNLSIHPYNNEERYSYGM